MSLPHGAETDIRLQCREQCQVKTAHNQYRLLRRQADIFVIRKLSGPDKRVTVRSCREGDSMHGEEVANRGEHAATFRKRTV